MLVKQLATYACYERGTRSAEGMKGSIRSMDKRRKKTETMRIAPITRA